MRPPHEVGAGAVLALDEEDYLYGGGFLALRVERLGAEPSSFPKLEYVRVVGRRVLCNGDGELRDVMMRVAAIERALRPNGWTPPRYRQEPPHRRTRSDRL